jgi:hypothetical protein
MNRYERVRRAAAAVACVGATTVLASLGAGAAPAGAATCDAGPLFASGSSFQGTAQGTLLKGWPATSKCTTVPSLTYTSTSSGKGLETFGLTTGKFVPIKDSKIEEIEKKEGGPGKGCGPTILSTPAECLDMYIGTDDAPTTAQLENGTTASGGKSNTGAKDGFNHRGDVVIPIQQGPVAFMISLPAGCKVLNQSRIHINNTTLAQVYEAKKAQALPDPGGIQAHGTFAADTWGALLTQLGYKEVSSESLQGGTFPNAVTFTETATPEETLTRVEPGAEEEVTTATLAEAKKGESKKVKVLNQKKVKVAGAGCKETIKDQIRASASGTSYAVKSYFKQINNGVWAAHQNDNVEWADEIGHYTQSNPVTSGGEVKGSKTILQEKGGQLAENTAANPGSFGYADTADASISGTMTERATNSQFGTGEVEEVVEREEEGFKVKELKKVRAKSINHQILWGQIQNTAAGTGEESAPTAAAEEKDYANPLKNGSTTPNCDTEHLVAGDTSFPKHWTESWNGTITSDPAAGTIVASDYPACAITYDVTSHHEGNSKLYGKTALAKEMAATSADFFQYAVLGKGQEELFKAGFYVSVPTAMDKYIAAAVNSIEA